MGSRLLIHRLVTPFDVSASGWPDASNTGVPVGTSMLAVPGSATSGTGWVWNAGDPGVRATGSGNITGLDIAGGFDDRGFNVNLTNSKIRCTGVGKGSFGTTLTGTSTLTDVEIGGGADGSTYQGAIGAYMGNGTVGTRLYVHHTIHGFRTDGWQKIIDSYIFNMPMGDSPFDVDHTDGTITTQGTTHNPGVWFEHCNFVSYGNNSGVFVQYSDPPDIGWVLVNNCRFESYSRNSQVASWAISVENKHLSDPSKIVLTNNVVKGGQGISSVTGTTYSNNTNEEDGSAITMSIAS